MKIALIYDAAYPWMKGGGEKALWEMATGLVLRGHEVHLFCCQLWDGPSTLDREGVQMHGVCRAGDFYREDGKRGILLPLRFGWGLFRALWSARTEAFDLTYCTVFPYFSVFSVWFCRLLTGQKNPWLLAWLEVWGWPYWRSYLGPVQGRIGAGIEWLCAHCCDQHLVLSPLQKRRLTDLLGVPEKKIACIPRGVAFPGQMPATEKIPNSLIYAGRLIDYKNLHTVLQAMPAIAGRFPHAQLTIVGSGPEEASLRELAHRLHLEQHVRFYPPYESLQNLWLAIGQVEILLQPSTREGQGVIVLEAMLIGTSVIAAAHPDSAVSDLLAHNESGLLVSDWSAAEAWAGEINRLLQDAALRARLETRAQSIAEGYVWDRAIMDRLENWFQQLCASTPSARAKS